MLDETTLEVREVMARRAAHDRGLLHRCVHVLVFDPAGRLWLQKRGLDRRLYPGLWTSTASGHVAAGEDEATSVLRELEEEVGLRLDAQRASEAPRRVAEFRFRDAHEHEVAGLWVARTDAQARARRPEVLAVMALGREELNTRLTFLPGAFAPSFRAALAAYDQAGPDA